MIVQLYGPEDAEVDADMWSINCCCTEALRESTYSARRSRLTLWSYVTAVLPQNLPHITRREDNLTSTSPLTTRDTAKRSCERTISIFSMLTKQSCVTV
jgi:hypothetical protein